MTVHPRALDYLHTRTDPDGRVLHIRGEPIFLGPCLTLDYRPLITDT